MNPGPEISKPVSSRSDLVEVGGFVREDQPREPISNLTDAELISEFAKSKSTEAMSEFVCRHSTKVLMVCQSINFDRNDVEDAYQATFLAAIINAKKLDSVHSHGAWLCRVAQNASLKILKSKQRMVLDGESETLSRKPDPLPETWRIIENRETFQQLLIVLLGLPKHYRECLVLAYFEDLSRSEIAIRMDKSESSVKALLQRGKKLLKSRLIAQGTTTSLAFAGISFSTPSIGVPRELAELTIQKCFHWATPDSISVPENILHLAQSGKTVSLVNATLFHAAVFVMVLVVGLSGMRIMDQPAQRNQAIELTAKDEQMNSKPDLQIRATVDDTRLSKIESLIESDTAKLNKLNDWMIHKQEMLNDATDRREIQVIEQILNDMQSESNEIRIRLAKNSSLLRKMQPTGRQ